MNKMILVGVSVFGAVMVQSAVAANLNPAKPNVLMIYFDDMGYGDMGANGATPLKIPADSKFLDPAVPSLTPNLDRFAEQGMRFTHGHSSDGVCSPSRYSLLTGHYSWRTSLKKGVVGGYSSTFMAPDRFTIATLFKRQGYQTAMVGKWHIGMSFHDAAGNPVDSKKASMPEALKNGALDLSKPVMNTPAHHGFDYWFGTPSSLDMPPYAWLESNASGHVNVLSRGGLVANGTVDFSQARRATNDELVWFKKNDGVHARAGAKDPTFAFEDYLQVQAQKVSDLIEGYKKSGDAFMIYVPVPAPHQPHATQKKFQGSAGFDYGDYVVQTDYYAGEMLKALGDPKDPTSLAANTVVFITSDNGPEVGAQAKSTRAGHDANGPWAGIKRDSYEGGTRVPFMVRWPGQVQPGVTNHACWQGDFLATMADYLGDSLGDQEAPDAESFLSVLQGKPMPKARRAGFVEHSSQGQFSIVDANGEWKLIDGTGCGGFAMTVNADNKRVNGEGVIRGNPRQLFNLNDDPGERHNLLLDPNPKAKAKAAELYDLLNQIRGDTEWGTEGSSR